MDAKQFYNGFICSPEIQTKYDGEDKRDLLFELMEKYADYKSKNPELNMPTSLNAMEISVLLRKPVTDILLRQVLCNTMGILLMRMGVNITIK